MDTFLVDISVVADWFRQFLYDISDVFLDREWTYYEDHTSNVWFGIIYTVLFLAIIPFLTDLIFTFILSVRSRRLVFGHTLLLQRFGIYSPKDSSLKYGSVSTPKEYRVFKPDSRSINTPRIFALSSSSTNKPILYSVQSVNSTDIKYHSLGYSSPQFKDVTSHGLRNTGLDNTAVSNKPFVSDTRYKNVNQTLNYSSISSRDISSKNYSSLSSKELSSRISDRQFVSRNSDRHFSLLNNRSSINDSRFHGAFVYKFKNLRIRKGKSSGGNKEDD